MEVKDTQRNLLKYLTVFVFALFAMGALLAFGYYAIHTVVDLVYMESVIEFNKGAMYMLGVGLSAGLLTSFMIYEIQNRKISESYNKKATHLALIFIGLIFIFPQIVDYGVRQKIKSIGYVFCAKQSYSWLHAQNKVFGLNEAACTQLDANEISKSSSGH